MCMCINQKIIKLCTSFAFTLARGRTEAHSSPAPTSMEAGTRVEISGLQSRSDLNGCTGVALYYVPPMSNKQGRYLVKVDGCDERLGIKLNNLMACTHKEEVDGDKTGLGETVTVNGLMYCAAHRSEICGECAFNFRLMNRMRQLEPGDEVYDRAVKVDEDEAKRGEAPLRAPCKRTGKLTEVKSAPALNSKAKPARGLDPSKCPQWPKDRVVRSDATGGRGQLEQAFTNAFTMREKMMSHNGSAPLPSENPLYHVKESMLAMAERIEDCIEKRKPTPRFSLQDDAQTEVIFIDVVDVRKLPPLEGSKEDLPAIVVRYAYHTAGDMRRFMDSVTASMKMKTEHDVAMGFSEQASRDSGFQNMKSHIAEIKTARAILDENHKRLDPEFIENASSDLVGGFKISILQPVPKEGEAAPASTEVCSRCGKAEVPGGAPLKACAKCKVQKYCSRECQVADWKVHKKSCVTPEAEEKAEIIVVDMSVDVMAARGMPGMVTTMMPMDNSSYSRDPADDMKKLRVGAPEKMPAADKMFIVKIQVPMTSRVSAGPLSGVMMCYNQARDVQVHIAEQNCAVSARLDGIIRSGKIANGMKGYFNAYVSAGKLHIVAHNPLPLQQW